MSPPARPRRPPPMQDSSRATAASTHDVFPQKRRLYERLADGTGTPATCSSPAPTRGSTRSSSRARTPATCSWTGASGNLVPAPGGRDRGDGGRRVRGRGASRSSTSSSAATRSAAPCRRCSTLDSLAADAHGRRLARQRGGDPRGRRAEVRPSGRRGPLEATIRENVLVQLDHLRHQPSVAPRLADGRLQVHGWVFEIETRSRRRPRPTGWPVRPSHRGVRPRG